MLWNWQHLEWPHFSFDSNLLLSFERRFAEGAGVVIGAARHLDEPDRQAFSIEIMSREALGTSAIEGELLNRDSVQSSIRRQLGLASDRRGSTPVEAGIAEMMVTFSRTLVAPLDHDTLFAWHHMLMQGRRDLAAIGCYRRHGEPMQIISGADYAPRVHFEAPPSGAVPDEMERFLNWFHDTGPLGAHPLPPVTRAGIAHLWFESVHPFEDGNGRIGRAIIEKALAQGLSTPVFTAVAGTFLKHRKAYYDHLARASRTLDITDWLLWFGEAVCAAQRQTIAQVEWILHKARLFARLDGRLNARQEKALLRLFATGPDGFEGGLSAGNYMRITGAPPATTTRDLAELVQLGALTRRGERKATRYYVEGAQLIFEQKMMKAEDIISRYHNTLHILDD